MINGFINWFKLKFRKLDSQKEVLPEENVLGLDLSTYGVCLAVYKGTGQLTLDTGNVVKCAFEAGQLVSGDVILLCASESLTFPFPDLKVSSFCGTTREGITLSSNNKITEFNYLPNRPDGQGGCWAAFRLSELEVSLMKDRIIQSAHFGITNFKFSPTLVSKKSNGSTSSLPLTLKDKTQTHSLEIKHIENYEKILNRVRTLKSIDVTCEAVTTISSIAEGKMLEDIISNLCQVLSVARGTKIQWVYCDYYDKDEKLVSRIHRTHVTKPFCPMCIIDSGVEGRKETQSFIEGAYINYVSRRIDYQLDKGTIDTYLDAKSEGDYLEMRGAKLAVALEKLKAVFLKLPSTTTNEFVIDDTIFEGLSSELKDAASAFLTAKKVKPEARSGIYENLTGLNRKSFKKLLGDFFTDIGISLSPADIKLFIQCRNKLVHAGDFYCNAATPDERRKCPPLSSPAEEYYFMVNFLDKIFLRLLGYSGEYCDYNTLVVSGTVKKSTIAADL